MSLVRVVMGPKCSERPAVAAVLPAFAARPTDAQLKVRLEMTTTTDTRSLNAPASMFTWRGKVCVLAPTEIIVGNRQLIKQTVLDALDAGGRAFLFDFTQTGYIDSSGLGVLLSIVRKVREFDARMVLCGLNADLRTLMELTKIDHLFVVADTVARGLEYLEQPR